MSKLERAENISLAIIKSIALDIQKQLVKQDINISTADIMKELKDKVRDTEIYQFTDAIIDHIFKIKVAYYLDRIAMELAVEDLLSLLERIGGYREKYNAIVQDAAQKAREDVRKKDISVKMRKVSELASALREKIHKLREEEKRTILEKRRKKK